MEECVQQDRGIARKGKTYKSMYDPWQDRGVESGIKEEPINSEDTVCTLRGVTVESVRQVEWKAYVKYYNNDVREN